MMGIITCEHAGNEVPKKYVPLFAGSPDVLQTHRGWDLGALEIAQQMADELSWPLHYTTISRLIIEANRSVDSGDLFSEFTQHLSATAKKDLIEKYYMPYRKKVEHTIATATRSIMHLSIHSFTPIWKGAVRPTDIGLLFDPNRKHELDLCIRLKQACHEFFPNWQIDFNEPYNGTDDGFTTHLRTAFSEHHYAGIEIEVNQKYQGNAQIAAGLVFAITQVKQCETVIPFFTN